MSTGQFFPTHMQPGRGGEGHGRKVPHPSTADHPGASADVAALRAELRETLDALANLARRVETLEERFREHGHIGETATVGLGSCWDGS